MILARKLKNQSKLYLAIFALAVGYNSNAQETQAVTPAETPTQTTSASETASSAQKASGVDEISAAKLYNEGLGALKAKDYKKGLEVMELALSKAKATENEKVIKLASKNGSLAASKLAKAKLKAKDYEGAKALYTKGLELDKNNLANMSGLAKCAYKQKNYDQAVDLYAKTADAYKAAEKEDKIKNVLKMLNVIVGKTYAKKDYDKVIAYGQKALSLGNNPSIAYYVGKAYLNKGDANKALELADSVIPQIKDSTEDTGKYYMAKAEALEKLGRKSEAKSVYESITSGKYLEQAKYKAGQLK